MVYSTMCRNLGRVGQTVQNKALLIYFFVFSCTLFVFHPYLFLGLDCPEFCLYLQHTDIQAPGGIQTRNPINRLAAVSRLRPLGHWNCHIRTENLQITI